MKKIILIPILSIITIFAFGQEKILPDTLHNTDYIDVVRIKDTVIIINEWGGCKLEATDEIIFPNGKKIYCHSVYPPAVSENGKMVVYVNYPEKPFNIKQFSEITLDVYNYNAELVKSYPFYIEKDFIYKLWGYHVFNNGNLLILNSHPDLIFVSLYLYKKDTIINLFDQKYGENSINNIRIQFAIYKFIEELQFILIQIRSNEKGKKMQNQFLLYNYSGNLISSYDIINNHTKICHLNNVRYNKNKNIIEINYYFVNEEIKYKLIFNIKTQKFTNYETF